MKQLKVIELSRTYRDQSGPLAALDGINISAEGGQITAIVGPSGCGKTTLLNILSRLDSADAGTIMIDGVSLELSRARIGYLFQTPTLVPWRTVLQNAVLGSEIDGQVKSAREETAAALLDRYGLRDFSNHYPATLSQGMQQRVSLIRLILFGAELILLDEPFRGLDYWTKRELQRDIATAVEEKKVSALLVSHDVEDAALLGDHIYVFSRRPGHVVSEYDVRLPRARRLESPPGALDEVTSVMQMLWKDLQLPQSSLGISGR